MSGLRIGFVGVGVVGEPMCRNLVRRHDGPVICYDLNPAPLGRLAADGADHVFLSLPSSREVRAVCLGDGSRTSPTT